MKRIALVPFLALALPAFAASALADTLDVGDGVKIWYAIKGQGDGPPIIVVHGGPGMDSGSLSGDLGPLEAKHRLLYYDQRGGGRSSLPADTKLLTIDRHVDDLETLRRHLGIVIFVGASLIVSTVASASTASAPTARTARAASRSSSDPGNVTTPTFTGRGPLLTGRSRRPRSRGCSAASRLRRGPRPGGPRSRPRRR